MRPGCEWGAAVAAAEARAGARAGALSAQRRAGAAAAAEAFRSAPLRERCGAGAARLRGAGPTCRAFPRPLTTSPRPGSLFIGARTPPLGARRCLRGSARSRPPCPSRGARGWRLRGMARARPSVAGGGGAAPPERAGPGRPRRSRTGHCCDPERPGLRAAPRTPGPGAGRRAAKLRPGRGWWALLLLQLHLLRALAQGRCGPDRRDTPGVDFVGASRGGL